MRAGLCRQMCNEMENRDVFFCPWLDLYLESTRSKLSNQRNTPAIVVHFTYFDAHAGLLQLIIKHQGNSRIVLCNRWKNTTRNVVSV